MCGCAILSLSFGPFRGSRLIRDATPVAPPYVNLTRLSYDTRLELLFFLYFFFLVNIYSTLPHVRTRAPSFFCSFCSLAPPISFIFYSCFCFCFLEYLVFIEIFVLGKSINKLFQRTLKNVNKECRSKTKAVFESDEIN